MKYTRLSTSVPRIIHCVLHFLSFSFVFAFCPLFHVNLLSCGMRPSCPCPLVSCHSFTFLLLPSEGSVPAFHVPTCVCYSFLINQHQSPTSQPPNFYRFVCTPPSTATLRFSFVVPCSSEPPSTSLHVRNTFSMVGRFLGFLLRHSLAILARCWLEIFEYYIIDVITRPTWYTCDSGDTGTGFTLHSSGA